MINEQKNVRSLDVNDDGTSFINVYSAGKTILGRMMSNFYPSEEPIKTPEGHFNTIEGYWYYLRLPEEKEEKENLKNLNGFECKKLGMRLCKECKIEEYAADDQFQTKIKLAILEKIVKSPKLLKELEKSSLPFVHFYTFGKGNNVKVVNGSHMWVIEFWEDVRNAIQNTSKITNSTNLI